MSDSYDMGYPSNSSMRNSLFLITSNHVKRKAISAKIRPLSKIILLSKRGAYTLTAANATKNGDQYASEANARVRRTICESDKGFLLCNLSPTSMSDDMLITEPKRCTPKYVLKKEFLPFGICVTCSCFGLVMSLKNPTPTNSVSKY